MHFSQYTVGRRLHGDPTERRQSKGKDWRFHLDGNRRMRRRDGEKGCCVGGVLTCLFGLCVFHKSCSLGVPHAWWRTCLNHHLWPPAVHPPFRDPHAHQTRSWLTRWRARLPWRCSKTKHSVINGKLLIPVDASDERSAACVSVSSSVSISPHRWLKPLLRSAQHPLVCRSNRMDLGHGPILCNLLHLAQKQGQNERPTVRLEKREGGCLTQPTGSQPAANQQPTSSL